jgi:hypothetical protein
MPAQASKPGITYQSLIACVEAVPPAVRRESRAVTIRRALAPRLDAVLRTELFCIVLDHSDNIGPTY